MRALAATTLCLTLAAGSVAEAERVAAKDGRSADDIVDEFLEIDPITYGGSDTTLAVAIANARGDVRHREMVMKSRRDDDTRRSFIRFLSPSDVRGTSFLGLNDSGDRTQYVFLPALGRERRVGDSQRNARFAGTDYSFADLDSRDIEDSRRRRLADQKIAAQDAYQIELVPKHPKSAYARIQMFIDKSTMLPLAIKYFNDKGTEIKRFLTLDAKKIDGHWVIARSKMVDLKRDHSTQMTVKKITFNRSIPLEQFSVRALKRE